MSKSAITLMTERRSSEMHRFLGHCGVVIGLLLLAVSISSYLHPPRMINPAEILFVIGAYTVLACHRFLMKLNTEEAIAGLAKNNRNQAAMGQAGTTGSTKESI